MLVFPIIYTTVGIILTIMLIVISIDDSWYEIPNWMKFLGPTFLTLGLIILIDYSYSEPISENIDTEYISVYNIKCDSHKYYINDINGHIITINKIYQCDNPNTPHILVKTKTYETFGVFKIFVFFTKFNRVTVDLYISSKDYNLIRKRYER